MAAGEKKKPAVGGKGKDGKAGRPGRGGGDGWYVLLLAVIVAVFAFLGGIRYAQSCPASSPDAAAAGRGEPARPLDQPVRPAPARFPPDSNLPEGKELAASGAVDPAAFSPGRDLVRFEDSRVWFESDHAGDRAHDDHTIHRCLEEPLRRLVALSARRGASLRVFDGYRPEGVHRGNSLHREGRAIDLTADGASLEELAKLCWQAGFDWVFHEDAAKGGAHVHCSARAARAPTGGAQAAAPAA